MRNKIFFLQTFFLGSEWSNEFIDFQQYFLLDSLLNFLRK